MTGLKPGAIEGSPKRQLRIGTDGGAPGKLGIWGMPPKGRKFEFVPNPLPCGEADHLAARSLQGSGKAAREQELADTRGQHNLPSCSRVIFWGL